MRPTLSRFPLAGLVLFVLLCAVLAGSKFSPSGTSYYPVTTTADDGPGSLRSAIAQAGDGDVIYFDAALNGQTISLSSGELAIHSSISIQGPGPNLLTVRTISAYFRTFHVLPGHTVTIQGLTIRHGGQNGAAILNDHSTLDVKNCFVGEGPSVFPPTVLYGGGINNDGSAGSATLTIVDCIISSNYAYYSGGGIYNDASSGGSATISMWNSTVTGNIAGYSGVPTGDGHGGGIFNNGSGARMTLTNCIVSSNVAGEGGDTRVGDGGGITNSGTLTILVSTISGNRTYSRGGGISSSGILTIINSTVSGNSAEGRHDGIGLGTGGGLSTFGVTTLTNSTLSSNFASNGGGGLYGKGTITHSTIAGNGGSGGGSIVVSGGLTIGNTILSGVGGNIIGSQGSVNSLGYNISNDDGGGFLTGPGDQINTDPRLASLQNNGGPTLTHALLNGSPAIDTGDPGFAPPPYEDQRGYPRVFNGRLDIGSLEVQPTPSPTPTPTPSASPCGIIVNLDENFDGITAPALPPGWSSSFTPGQSDCTPGGTCPLGTNWASSNNDPYSGPHCVFHDAPGCVIDSVLVTPSFIAGPSNQAFLTFQQSFDLENGRDGGVLEISINGGPFVDFADAGGQPGYTGTIASDSFSPLAGRAAWTGNSGGYQNRSMIFPIAAQGQNVRLRFRLATDCSGASSGWRIDNLRVEDNIGCQPPTPTPTPPPVSPTPTPTPTNTPLPTPCGVTFSENFDGVTAPALPGGWSATSTPNGIPWRTSTTLPAGGSNDAFAQTPTSIGNIELVSPVIAAPAAGGILSFQNLFKLPASMDGLVLEISINGGPYSDIIAAGGSFLDGGYNRTIDFCCSSPIAGRMAWSGLSAGYPDAPAYIASTVRLPPTASGQSIRLKWRLVSDSYPDLGEVRIDSLVITPACATPTPTPTANPTVSPIPTPARARNISTRLRVETGDRVMIGGFIITGSGSKRVALRGIGPSLANFGIADALADPILELRDSSGALLVQNDNWQDTPTDQGAQLAALGLAPQHPNESGIVATLPSSAAYTAILSGKNGGTGVGLVEVYDTDQGVDSQLANISTRGFVQTGDNVMIGGFILEDTPGGTSVVVRGIGPSLSQVGLSNVLANPTLELRDSNGMLLIANDNWQDDSVSAAQLTARGLSPQVPLESGIFASLPAGAFTAILAGKNGGSGIGLIEIYNVQ